MSKEKLELTDTKPIARIGISREAVRQQQDKALRKARRLLRERGYKAEDFFNIFIKTEKPNKC